MSVWPLPFRWDGEHMVPLKPRAADRQYTVGEVYTLAVEEQRSQASHNHYFAEITEAWRNLPEDISDQYPTAEHLRKRALIAAGFYDQEIIDCETPAVAERVASTFRKRDEFAAVVIRGAVVVVRYAKSQAKDAMKKAEFEDSKQKVLEIVSEIVGVDRGALSANAGAAA